MKRGKQLCHAAIAAREYGVPYYLVSDLDLQALDQGRLIALDPNAVFDLDVSNAS